MNDSSSNAGKGVTRRGVFKAIGATGLCAAVGGVSAVAANKANASSKEIDVLIDFPDDDYSELVTNNIDSFEGLNADLLMRSFFYIDRAKKIARIFNRVHQQDKRNSVLTQSRVVITPSIETALEVFQTGTAVVFIYDEKSNPVEKRQMEARGQIRIPFRCG